MSCAPLEKFRSFGSKYNNKGEIMRVKCFINKKSYSLALRSESPTEAQLLSSIVCSLRSSHPLKPEITMAPSGQGHKNMELSFSDITREKYDELSDFGLPVPATFEEFQRQAHNHEQARKGEVTKLNSQPVSVNNDDTTDVNLVGLSL
jgi:hypothetical protein